MRYKSDYTDRAQEPEAQEYAPITYNTSLLPSNTNDWMTRQPQGGTGYGPTQPGVPMPTGFPSSGPGTQMPTGVPTSGTGTPMLPMAPGQPTTYPAPVMPIQNQVPVTVENPLFTPGFLRTQIGKRMRVEFLIGTNGTTDRLGTLVAVGASYILLRPIESNDLMLCDIYSIKFVTILNAG